MLHCYFLVSYLRGGGSTVWDCYLGILLLGLVGFVLILMFLNVERDSCGGGEGSDCVAK